MKRLVALIFLSALLLRLPLLGTVYYRTPDAIEYINLARNIESGKGFYINIKNTFFKNDPVVTSAFKNRPVMTSIIFAAILKIFHNNSAIQLFELLVGSLNAVLVYFLARKFVSNRLSVAAGFLAGFNPNILITNRLSLSEIIFSSFVLTFLIILFQTRSKISGLLLGLFGALAFFTRFEGAFLFIPLIFIYKKRAYTPLIIIGLSILSFCLINLKINGDPFYSYNKFHYMVFEYQEGFKWLPERNLPTPSQFISDNASWVINRTLTVILGHLKSLISLDYLGLFSPFVILLFKNKKYWGIGLFCIAVFGMYSSLWSAIFERSRHFIAIYYLLIVGVMWAMQKIQIKFLVISLIAVMFVAYTGYDIHRIAWARDIDTKIGNWNYDQKGNMYDWIVSNTEDNVIIAAVDPWIVNLNTNRSTILIPKNLDSLNMLMSFSNNFNVDYVLIDDKDSLKFNMENIKASKSLSGATIYCLRNCKE